MEHTITGPAGRREGRGSLNGVGDQVGDGAELVEFKPLRFEADASVRAPCLFGAVAGARRQSPRGRQLTMAPEARRFSCRRPSMPQGAPWPP